ncbi:MAG: methyltransferase domain-containing protein [Polyangiaceae bacterium]
MNDRSPAYDGTWRYDEIGGGYAVTRREDPLIRRFITEALANSKSVVNVGAGCGSYEPRDRYVIPVEPSDVMAAQRPSDLAPAIRADASLLPLRDDSVDAAMALLTIHHWDAQQRQGVLELRRVARGPVVILTCDTNVFSKTWLVADYLPELAELDARTFPTMHALCDWLGGTTRIEVIPVPKDSHDWSLMSFWAHPERVLDSAARRATSGLARLPPAVVDRAVLEVARDLRDGTWDTRHGRLRDLTEYDAGLRLLVNHPIS